MSEAKPTPYFVDTETATFKEVGWPYKTIKAPSRKRAKKRVTPEDDFRRLAERIWQRGREKIKNKADFLSVYSSYMRDSNVSEDKDLRERVFEEVQHRHPKVSSSLKSSKERVGVFKKAGERPSAAEFDIVGEIRGRTVMVRRTVFEYKKRDGSRGVRTVYRDVKGRFATPK